MDGLLYSKELQELGLSTRCPKCGGNFLFFVVADPSTGKYEMACSDCQDSYINLPKGISLSQALNYFKEYVDVGKLPNR